MELINLYIDENPADKSGVSAIALVDSPAIEEGWIAFSKPGLKKYTIQLGSQKGDFKPIDGDKQIIAGALMVPHKEIYRKDENGKEYNVKFSPTEILKIQRKHALGNRNTAINEMHNNGMPVNGGLIEQFIIDRTQGKTPPFGQDHLDDGTWFGMIYIADKNIWDSFIKTGIYTGFSVEGYFYEQPAVSEEMKSLEEFWNDLFEHL